MGFSASTEYKEINVELNITIKVNGQPAEDYINKLKETAFKIKGINQECDISEISEVLEKLQNKENKNNSRMQ